jgi:hypothetical protein
MESKEILKSFGKGLGVFGMVAAFVLPMSLVMNKFIYHPPTMRLILGVLGGLGSIITLGIVKFAEWKRAVGGEGGESKAYYFGLIPLLSSPPTVPEGWSAFFYRFIINPALSVFRANIYGTEDIEGLRTVVEQGYSLLPKPTPENLKQTVLLGQSVSYTTDAVCEEAIAAAQKAGQVNPMKWGQVMDAIESSKIFEVQNGAALSADIGGI